MIVIYAGPTLNHDEIAQHIDCVCLPPVSHTDILKILPDKPDAIGIIDGYFEGAPSVWHKEILYALDQGIHVYGSSSMGALRAAELYPFGMVGVGQIFQWYRDGVISDDDEVAVLHGPEEVGFTAASEPMVSIRATLELAHEDKVINQTEKDLLVAQAKNTFYKNRSWKNVLKVSEELFTDELLSTKLEEWLNHNRIDLKKLDAIKMLKTMHHYRESFSQKPVTQFHFEWTNVWDEAVNQHGQSVGALNYLDDNDQKVLDQLRLKPDQFQRYRDKALLSWLCDHSVSTVQSDEGLKTALKQFRVDNQLSSRSQILDYMAQVEWDEAQLTALLKGVDRVNQIRETVGDLRQGILDELKLDGNYLNFLNCANLKQKAIESAGLDPDHPGVVPPQLLAWYFTKQLNLAIPHRLEHHLSNIDLDNREDFYRLIAADYLYWLVNDR